ncbi:sugar transferase [Lentilitoribacter sp. Alg239-R112]|uniref:sugar transferase n=1 Tax=Lentilitoribacter sp. Alg239-R112 TaxID=2305987 RepID=UPI001FCEE539|nr:sugar transferase [Lentilitoribacter sp. Alg239-R112]
MIKKFDWPYKITMRFIDLSAAVFILVVTSWLLLFIFVWVKFETPGPAIFRQKRVGLNGKIFICNKFRTMYEDTEDAASHLISATKITKSGRFLRATKLDELPQAWNILLNEMAIVGPRPCLPNQKRLIAERIERNVLMIKPGITGWSQIRNIDMSDPIRLAKSDAEYLKYRSVVQDIKIMVLTVSGKGQGDKVNLS